MIADLSPNADIRMLGYWWLPGMPLDDRVPGVLTFSAEKGGALELIGGFDRELRFELGGYPRVLGEVEHECVTLLDCWTSSRRMRSGSAAPRENIGVSRGVIGILFSEPNEPVQFDRCRVHLKHLTQWSQVTGLSLNDDHWKGPGDPEKMYATIEAKWVDPIKAMTDMGWELTLSQRLQPLHEMNLRMSVEQEVVLELSAPGLTSPEQFVDLISDFQDLVTIGTGRPAQIDDVIFEHPQAPVQFASGETHPTARTDLRFFARWNAVDKDTEPLNWAILFFSFDDLDGVEGVMRWMKVAAEYRTELGRVMSVKYRKGMSFADQIVNLTAALESFDHRRAPSKIKDLRVRLARLITLCEPIFSPGMVATAHLADWYQAVIDHRDNAAHHRGRPTAHSSAQQHFLSQSLYWLFVIAMLKLAQAPDSALERILRHNEIYWLRDGLASAFVLDLGVTGP